MPQGIFITGTDTGVGKTFIASGIASALKKQGINAGVMKPIHTGCRIKNGALVPEDSVKLAMSAGVGDPLGLITPYLFKEPAAPYIAAKENRKKIDPDKIIESFEELCKRHDFMIVEGIGGVLVPITRNFFVADLIRRFNIPALIVTRPGLGTINHTLLTIDYLKGLNIPIGGVLINYNKKGKATLAEKSCKETIERLSDIPVIGIIPYISKYRPASLNPFLKLSNSLFNIRG